MVVGERADRDLDLTDGKHRDVGGIAVETADLLTVDVQVQMALAIDMVDALQEETLLKQVEEARSGLAARLSEAERQHMVARALVSVQEEVVRKHGFEPEETLRAANRKFITRFRTMEDLAGEDGVDFAALDLDTQEQFWERAKTRLKTDAAN